MNSPSRSYHLKSDERPASGSRRFLRKKDRGLAVWMGAVGAMVFLKSVLREAVEGKRRHSAFKPRGGDAPSAVGAAPAGEVVAFDPDQAFTHTSRPLRAFGLELGGDGWNTSREGARKV